MMKMFLFGLQNNNFWGSFQVFKILLRCAGRIIKRIDWVVSDWNQSFIGIQEEGMGGFFILSRFPFVEQIGFLLETKKTKRWESFDLQLTSSQHCSWIFNNNNRIIIPIHNSIQFIQNNPQVINWILIGTPQKVFNLNVFNNSREKAKECVADDKKKKSSDANDPFKVDCPE